ncbi:MAG: hypothetical protein WCG47_30630, partial [Dermatophilaceae bacterium]
MAEVTTRRIAAGAALAAPGLSGPGQRIATGVRRLLRLIGRRAAKPAAVQRTSRPSAPVNRATKSAGGFISKLGGAGQALA